MLQITPQMRILVAVEPVDFRKGIDGLAQFCRQALGEDPLGGALFVFRNRRGTAVKALVYDGQGFWLCQKKLESEDSPIFGFTEVGQCAHDRHVSVAGAGRMVGISRKTDPRRCFMPRQGSLSVPPRARPQREPFYSTNFGHS
jgi:IS66 Orf2 like protein